jgi:hypothetical protein
MKTETLETALSLAAKIPDLLRSAKSDSLVEFTRPTRVEPIVLMDDRVVNLTLTPDLLQVLTSIFSGYYLQAVALSVNIGKIDVIGLLDRVNPNRSLDDNTLKGLSNLALRSGLESAESYRYGLPLPNSKIGLEHYGLEESVYDVLDPLSSTNEPKDPKLDNLASRSGKDTVKLAQDVSNLAVGKLLEVEIESEGHRAVFPIAVRLIITAAPPTAIVNILSVGNRNTSVKERWHAWRAGQLEFVRDLVLCQDLIDAHKDSLMHDDTGIYANSIKRRKSNGLSAILSGQPSVATASNIYVISDATKKELERVIGGRFKDFRTREKIFKATYHRSIEHGTELSAGDLKFSKGGKGPDVGEILKAYTLGQAPRF